MALRQAQAYRMLVYGRDQASRTSCSHLKLLGLVRQPVILELLPVLRKRRKVVVLGLGLVEWEHCLRTDWSAALPGPIGRGWQGRQRKVVVDLFGPDPLQMG